MTRRLLMIRHGQTTYNATRRMQGQLDTELSELGCEQAEAAARALEGQGIMRIVASDLGRARETAQIIGERLGLPVSVDERLRETHLGQWQGRTAVEIDEEDPGARAHWRHNPQWAPPEGESRLEVACRARPVIEELVAAEDAWPGSSVLLVAHGGTISALTSCLLGLDVEQFPLFGGLQNTRWSQLIGRAPFDGSAGTQWYLEGWNMGCA